VLERTGSEIEQECKTQARRREGVHGLGLMTGIEPGYRIDFHNEFCINDQIFYLITLHFQNQDADSR